MNKGVEKYLSPLSGKRATIVFPSFSGFLASSIAAKSAAPEDIPTRIPSFDAISLPYSNAYSFSTVIISSYIFVLSVLGINPAPIPWIL